VPDRWAVDQGTGAHQPSLKPIGSSCCLLLLAGGFRSTTAAGVRENKIGLVSELQWIAAVLLKHWIAGGRQWRRLTTTGRSCGGAPARRGARNREMQWELSVCVGKRGRGGASGRALRLERHERAKLLLAILATCVAARAAAARRGGARRSQRGAGQAVGAVLEGTGREEERRGGSWGSGKRPAGSGCHGREQSRAGGWR
jgi:hypothetical protein